MIPAVELIAVFAAAFAQRALYRYIHPGNKGYDAYFHLYYIRAIRRNGNKVPYELPNIVGPNLKGYPYLFHWLLSFASERTMDGWLERYLNPLLDACFAVFVFWGVTALGGSTGTAVAAVLIYLFTPMHFTMQSTGPRVESITPRVFGEVLTNVAFVLLVAAMHGGGIWLLAGASFISMWVLASSRFAAQALVFISIPMSFVPGGYLFIVNLAAAFVMAVVFSRGAYLAVLRAHLRHIKTFYDVNKLEKYHFGSTRAPVAAVIGALKRREWASAWGQLIANPFLSVLLKNHAYLAAACISAYYAAGFGDAAPYPPEYRYLILFALLAYIVTSTRIFRILGEGERYINHVAFMTCFIAGAALPWGLVAAMAVYGILFQVFDLWLAERSAGKKWGYRHKRALLGYLASLSPKRNILCVPYHIAGYAVLYETAHNLFIPLLRSSNTSELDFLWQQYPIVNLNNLDAIAGKYGVDYVVIQRPVLAGKFPGFKPSTGWHMENVEEFDVVTLAKI